MCFLMKFFVKKKKKKHFYFEILHKYIVITLILFSKSMLCNTLFSNSKFNKSNNVIISVSGM